MKHTTRRRLLLLFIVLIAVAVAGFVTRQDDTFFAIKKNFTIFGAVYEELTAGYVDPVDPERFMRTGIDAMLNTLDPYTVFFNEADNEDFDIAARGRYGEVGLDLAMKNGRVTVLTPLEGYSAFEKGVRPGDIVLEVDGRSVQGLSGSEVELLLRGDPGTTVAVQIEREGEPEPIDFVLTRSELDLKNVSYTGFVEDGIGYIRLERFGYGSQTEVQQAVRDLQEDETLSGIVLDLRNNLGGLLDAAVDITGLFVPQGSAVVSTRGRLPETERVYRSRMPPLAPDLPLTVLINENSASASEIVAGAIQDLDRGVVVGERSFGKGLVQTVRPMPYNTSLKITMSKYYTPSGRSIQAVNYAQDEHHGETVPDSLRNSFQTTGGRTVRDGGGIEPDLPVGAGEMGDLETALVRQSAFFRFANAYASTHESLPTPFIVSDEMLEAFESWLDEQGFTYETRAERSLARLETELNASSYTGALDQLNQLRAEVAREKALDFDRHADALKERLRTEILTRYLGQTAQIEASFEYDPVLREALSVLRDPVVYESVLAPDPDR